MRILIISFFFPPTNAIGAVRVGKLAQFLIRQGHDVRVLCGRSTRLPDGPDDDVALDGVVRTNWIDVNWLPLLLAGDRRPAPTEGGAAGIAGRLSRLYRAFINLPDGHVGWLPWALAAGRRILDDWRPDLIFASARPYTGLIVAARLGKRAQVPFVAELRDLWAGNPYDDLPSWRRAVDARLEHRILSSAAGLVTVSEPLAAELRRRYRKPTAVIMNGYDPQDYPPHLQPIQDGKLRIVHTGMIYPGRRDPAPLFEALARLGNEAEDIRVLFYGRLQGNVVDLANRYGVRRLVETPGFLAYRDSLAAQASADVLLLLLWNDPREEGVLTGKLFEYLGARRPILAVGYVEGEAARLLRDRKAGITTNSPGEIAAHLLDWLQEKRRTGRVAALPAEVGNGFTRADQFTKLLDFFSTLPGVMGRT